MVLMPSNRFSNALDQALRAQDLPLERIASRLAEAATPVTTATLSYWRTGQRCPSRPRSLLAVSQLEKLLALAPGTLTDLLADDAWKMVNCHLFYRLGKRTNTGTPVHLASRLVIEVGLPTRRIRFFTPTSALTKINGGKLAKVSVNANGLEVAETRFEHTLAPGEVAIIEAEMSWVEEGRIRLAQTLSRPVELLVRRVEFTEPPKVFANQYFDVNGKLKVQKLLDPSTGVIGLVNRCLNPGLVVFSEPDG